MKSWCQTMRRGQSGSDFDEDDVEGYALAGWSLEMLHDIAEIKLASSVVTQQ